MTKNQKISDLIIPAPNKLLQNAQWRKANREWLRESKRIALEILLKLDEKDWKQKDLAVAINVTPQYINKLLRGNEKFPFEVLCKIQNILDFPLLAGFQAKQEKKSKTFEMSGILELKDLSKSNYTNCKVIEMISKKETYTLKQTSGY